MAKTDITISITTPTGINIAEAVRLFSARHYYQETIANPDYDPRGETSGDPIIANPEDRGAFSKRIVAEFVAKSIRDQKSKEATSEAEEAIDLGEEITVN